MVWRKYGLEMEFTGITRKRAAELLAEQFGTSAVYSFEGDKYTVTDARDRVWTVLPCPSVRAERWQNSRMVGANYLYQVKICTPLLYESDFETIEKILGRLETGGAVTNESTGMAVRLSMVGLNNVERFESNLANIYESRGALLQKAIGQEFDSLADCVNLKEQGVISLPLFPGSLDGNEVRSYIQLAQCIVDFAAKSKAIRQKENDSPNEKFRLRTWLVRIGFVGEEYKYARKLLTGNLSGNSAWLRKAGIESQAEETKTIETQTEGTMSVEIQQEENEIEIVPSGDVAEDGGFESLPSPVPTAEEETETEGITQDGIRM